MHLVVGQARMGLGWQDGPLSNCLLLLLHSFCALACGTAVCLVVSYLDFTRQGLKPKHQDSSSMYSGSSSSNGFNSSFRGTGWACFSMAVFYMWTGMSGLAQYALPTNPGEAFKMADIAQRHKIWDYWGYSGATMRV
jgi:hypothetical protein